MAQITKEQLLAISEDFEKVYQDMVDELLINIAKHFSDPNSQRTMFWEVQKLSELGALTEESRDIIAKHANVIPDLVEQKFWEVAKEANKDINPQLKEALKKGALSGTFKDIEASPTITRLLEEYIKQADNTMNLVNTTMLQSTLQAYSQVVQDITFYENQMQNAQSILNIASGMMTTNQTTRQGAFKWALDKMADEGITGFTDRLGRHWNAESYVAMVIRTTAHNVAINSVKERMNEYGSDIFQVSAHSGCRPSHYKFQNKFYSWSSPAGTFEDGLGRKHKYENITDVSADDKYGSTYPSAGGIFGINCSHYPIPIIPGLSIPRERNVQSKAESDKEYALSQEQRALERRIREQKRQLEIDKVSGMSDEVIKRDQQPIQDSQKQMRQFINETGRARRYDREKVSILPLETSKTEIFRSVGAAARRYPVRLPEHGEMVKLAEGQTLKGKVIAGKGAKTEIRDRYEIQARTGVNPDELKKVVGEGIIILDGKRVKAELHWYEDSETGELFDIKVQRYIDDD